MRRRFGSRVALLHGAIPVDERNAIIDAFRNGDVRVLVCTTVIETGIDIPAATLMIVEHAERFGLAQLHQLRGRVGRHQPGDALFVYSSPLSAVAAQRLKIIRNTHDGFELAEQDLKLRGEGDIIGNLQSGMPPYRLVSLPHHEDLVALAHQHAQAILDDDPQMQSRWACFTHTSRFHGVRAAPTISRVFLSFCGLLSQEKPSRQRQPA